MRNTRASLRWLGLLALVTVGTAVAGTSLASPVRSYPTGATCLKVDGAATPNATANVVDTQTAASTTTDAVLSLQPHVAGPAVVAWIASTMESHGTKKSVELDRYDYGAQTTVTAETLDPTSIQEIDLPTFDGASGGFPTWSIHLAPATSHTTAPQPGTVNCPSTVPLATKKWSGAAFRLDLDGVDGSRVAKIDPIVVRSTLLPAKPAARLGAEPLAMPRLRGAPPTSTTTISNMIVTTSTTGATLPALQAWLAGGHAAKNGAIVLLTQSLTDTLCTVRLTGVVITKITTDSGSPGVQPRARAEMTVGGIGLSCP